MVGVCRGKGWEAEALTVVAKGSACGCGVREGDIDHAWGTHIDAPVYGRVRLVVAQGRAYGGKV